MFSTITLNVARRPAVTVSGSTRIRTARAAGTSRSSSTIVLLSGGFSSRTCTAMRRGPAGTPVGAVTVSWTARAWSGNSEMWSVSSCTQPGSAPSTRIA